MANKMNVVELSELVKTMEEKNQRVLDSMNAIGVKTEHIFVQKRGAKYSVDVPMPVFDMYAEDMKGGVHKGLFSIWQKNPDFYVGFIYDTNGKKVGFWNWGTQYQAPVWKDYKTQTFHKDGLFQCWLSEAVISLVSQIWPADEA